MPMNAMYRGPGEVPTIIPVFPLSGALLSLDRAGGLAGWKWLFLCEAVPALVFGVCTWFFLTDRPENANWSQWTDISTSQAPATASGATKKRKRLGRNGCSACRLCQ